MRFRFCWILALGFALPFGFVANSDAAFQAPEGEQEVQPERVVSGLELEGELKAVDTDRRIILLVSDEGSEMLVRYDDQTEVVGQDDVQGLSGRAGRQLRIQYRAEGSNAFAERIEMIGEQ